jgi:uncharacterized membrane protein
MRNDLATVAAIAAGGVGFLLATQVDRRRIPHPSMASLRAWQPSSHRRHYIADHALPAGSALVGVAALVGGGLWLANWLKQSPGSASASTVQESVELDVPVRVAYNQWTQFEEFPKFMDSVQEVKQISDTHLHWRALVGGKVEEWESEITEQIPDKRIAWRSTTGVRNAGVVTFHKIAPNRTRVMLQMDYEPRSLTEKAGDLVGAVKLTTKGNLRRFKQLVEASGHETGGWRGTVPQSAS